MIEWSRSKACGEPWRTTCRLELLHRRFGRAIHLAIDAVEVANLVGINVEADGNAMTAPREYGVDVLKVFETSRMLPVCREDSHPTILATSDDESQSFTRVGALGREFRLAERASDDVLDLRTGRGVVRRQQTIVRHHQYLVGLELDAV